MSTNKLLSSLDFYPTRFFSKTWRVQTTEGPVKQYTSEYFEVNQQEHYEQFLDSIRKPTLPKRKEVNYDY